MHVLDGGVGHRQRERLAERVAHRGREGVAHVGTRQADLEARAAAREQRDDFVHAARVVVLRAGTERRMMAERDSPLDAPRGAGGKRVLEKLPVLRILVEAAAAEEVLLRRVEADELDVR